ncbi:MAG: hypothetical protein ABIN04_08890 [Ginsengibacter sp.]
MLTVDMMLKRSIKGQLDLMGPAMNVQKELMSLPDFGNEDNTLFGAELKTVANMKKSILMVAGAAVQKLMTTLSEEQEIVMNIADMLIETFIAESTLLRVIKSVEKNGEENSKIQIAMMRVYLNDSIDRLAKSGKEAINSFAQGDEQKMMLLGLRRFSKTAPFNAKEARRLVAAKLIEEGKV